MIVVIMGVSGSGKTTIGTMLADAIRCPFLEGDSLHSNENIQKMSHGIPLTDSDRAPWLTAIRAHILKLFKGGKGSCRRMLSSGAEVPGISRRRNSDHLDLPKRLSGTHSFAHEASAEALHEGGHAS